MARQLFAILLFIALLCAACMGWLWLNGTTPVLSPGNALPSDLPTTQYALSHVDWDTNAGGYHLYMPGTVTEDLILTVSDMEKAAIYFYGTPVAEWSGSDMYARVQTVTLPAAEINARGGIDLLFASDSWGSTAQELISRQTMTAAKLLLSGSRNTAHSSSVGFGITMFSLGLHVLLIASSLVLYMRKTSEKYLLLLVCVAAVSFVATLLTTNIAILPIRRDVYSMIRPLLSICPVMLHAAIGLSLYDDCAPAPLQRLLSVKVLLLMTLAVILLRFVSDYSIYTVLRWLLLVPIVWTLSRACTRRRPGAWAMLIAYVLSESVVLLLFFINNYQIAASGFFIVYLHMNQVSYLFVLICSMFVINRRFADKFRESEVLSEKLATINADLDALVDERTRQLREEQAKKHNMMTNIFHDLRSPIFIMQGNLDQLHPAREEQHLKTAMENKLAFLNRLTEDLFLIAKLEEGMILYEENRLDLNEVLRTLETPNRTEAHRQGIELTFAMAEPLWVWADEQRLCQCFQNLIDNAFRYTHCGGAICISTRAEGNAAVVQVKDNGEGIAEKDLPQIFERYFKSSRADTPRSSGLGLFIAREIVQHHHGTISVTSKQGEGSCFEIRLPLLS